MDHIAPALHFVVPDAADAAAILAGGRPASAA